MSFHSTRDLCIQWDFCHELIIWDGQPQDMFPVINASHAEIIERIVRICKPIPADVELGFHLCYGDFGAKHFVEPVDASKMVEVANAMAAAVEHEIAYVHMPIPIAWNEERYFKPFGTLKLSPNTEVYLGLVHMSDGVVGARHRIDLANKYVGAFGIATECGIARARKAGLIQDILNLQERDFKR